jgi:hypothetical protein
LKVLEIEANCFLKLMDETAFINIPRELKIQLRIAISKRKARN